MAFKFDVFISYKRADGAWAARLSQSLAAANLTPFRDVDRLRAGEDWLDQLEGVIRESQQLVFIWSKRTELEIGDVISQELHTFKTEAGGELKKTRRLVMLMLDEDAPPPAYARLHAHSVKAIIGRPVVSVEDMSDDEWDKVAARVIADLRVGQESKPINLLVLTTSAKWWEDDKNRTTPPTQFTVSPYKILEKLQVVTPQRPVTDFVKRYGAAPADRMNWMPFGIEGPSIKQIIDDVERDLNDWAGAAGQRGYRFVPVSDAIWGNDVAETQRIIRSLSRELSLIIIDPLSMHDWSMITLVSWLAPCFHNPKCVVITLGPNGWDADPPKTIRDQLKGLSKGIYDHFFSPPYPPPRGAQSASQVGHPEAIKRLVWQAIGEDMSGSQPTVPILSHS